MNYNRILQQRKISTLDGQNYQIDMRKSIQYVTYDQNDWYKKISNTTNKRKNIIGRCVRIKDYPFPV